MKIVVTGATSFLGAASVKELLDRGHKVYALVRPGSLNRKALPKEQEGLIVLETELSQLDRIEEKTASCILDGTVPEVRTGRMQKYSRRMWRIP